MMDDRCFPGILGDIAKAAGEDVASKIREAYGGTRQWIPGINALQGPKARDTEFVQLVGIEAARKIAEAIMPRCGDSIPIPVGYTRLKKLHDAIIGLSLEGGSAAKIAQKLGISARTVYRVRAKYRNGCWKSHL